MDIMGFNEGENKGEIDKEGNEKPSRGEHGRHRQGV